jgi:peptidoglycan hydrolase-like protein with peptidoglycan-binding domain
MKDLRRALLLVALVGGLLLPGLNAPAAAVATEPPGHAARPAKCQRTLPTYPILRPGDRGRSVATLQCSLNDVGVGPVVVDGFYGPQTKAAVRRIVDTFEGEPARPYRINNGFWVLLFGRQLPDRNLAVGAHGRVVKVLQRALRAAGADVAVDGDFGPQTERAVAQYQKANGVQPSAVVDDETRFFLSMGAVIGRLN